MGRGTSAAMPKAAPVTVHWGYADPSNALGGDEGKRQAVDLHGILPPVGQDSVQINRLPSQRACLLPGH